MRITKSQLRKIIKEETDKVVSELESSGRIGNRTIDRFFEEGALGYQLADKYSNALMIDEDSDFLAVIDAIKDGMRNWKEFRVPYADRKAAGVYENIQEAHGLSKEDAKTLKDFADDHLDDSDKNKKVKDIIKFLIKSNVKVDKTQDVTKMKKESQDLTEKSQYEAGSAGYHIEQVIRMARELDELEEAMPKPIRNKYATGLGPKIEEELAIALEVMDNTIDSYKSDLFDLRGDDEPEEADYDTETGEFIIGKG